MCRYGSCFPRIRQKSIIHCTSAHFALHQPSPSGLKATKLQSCIEWGLKTDEKDSQCVSSARSLITHGVLSAKWEAKNTTMLQMRDRDSKSQRRLHMRYEVRKPTRVHSQFSLVFGSTTRAGWAAHVTNVLDDGFEKYPNCLSIQLAVVKASNQILYGVLATSCQK